jgi:hypothetical protein
MRVKKHQKLQILDEMAEPAPEAKRLRETAPSGLHVLIRGRGQLIRGVGAVQGRPSRSTNETTGHATPNAERPTDL